MWKKIRLETRYAALSTETTLLEQELSTLPLRTRLLEARRDRAEADVDSIGQRTRLLAELIDRKRRQAAQQAISSVNDSPTES